MNRVFRLVSLGCAKNLVDSESLAASLLRRGWTMTPDGPADLVLVNTCAFVEEAAQESVDALLAETENKRRGETRWLGAVGCLPQKYLAGLADAMPELDLVVGVGDLWRVDELAEQLIGSGERQIALAAPSEARYLDLPRVLSTPPHRAYLKIADGCSNDCAYCIIGRLRGPFRSRSWDAVLAEARELTGRGVVEISLVAQDLTRYGLDLQPPRSLNELLRELDEIERLRWLRLLYVHPARVDEGLARTMATGRNIVPYLDIPLQHVSDRMLALMRRPQTKETTERAVSLLREIAPRMAIRTTFLLGHPGETEDDVDELLDFMRRRRFDHVGAFVWSPEEGTASFDLPGRVDPDTAHERLERVMTLQQEISHERLREKIGQTFEVLVEEVLHKHDDDAYSHIGRIAQQAPEVDGVTYVRAPREDSCRVGEFARAVVTETDVYDLFADLV